MKVLLVNGSPHEKGETYTALSINVQTYTFFAESSLP